MAMTKRWTVDIFLGEDEGRTSAEAHLRTGDDTRLSGTGTARLNPHDEDVPEIGDEVAAARALNDLGLRLLLAAAADIQETTDEPVAVASLKSP